MTRQTLNRGTVANDGTGDTLRTAALKIEQNFTEIYQKLGGSSSVLMPLVSFDSSGIIFEGTTVDDYETKLTAADPSADRTITLPNADGNVVLDTAQQTLTNKTLTSAVLTTPQINDTSADHQYIVAVSELAADRTVTLPLLTGNDEFTFNAHAQTLTNKTLSTPQINQPKIGAGLFDSASNELLLLTPSATPVNYLDIASADAGSAPSITAAGGDTNVNLELTAKGTGMVDVTTAMRYTPQTMTGAGAADLTVTLTLLNSASTFAVSVADGTQTGQVKMFGGMNSGVATVTPTNMTGGTSITVGNGQAATLIWQGSSWIVSNLQGAVIV